MNDARRLHEANPDPVIAIGVDGTVVYANPAAHALMQAWGSSVGAAAPEDIASLVAEPGGARADVVVADRVIEFVASATSLDGATVLHGRDVTKWHDASEALRSQNDDLKARMDESTAELEASNHQLHAVLNAVDEGVVTINAAGEIGMVNRHLSEIWGYAEGELLGMSLTMLMPEEYRDRHTGGLQRYTQTRQGSLVGSRVELAGRRKDGSEFPLELLIAETDIGGELFFTGSIRDITERTRAERQLRQSEERFRTVFGSSVGGILLARPDGVIFTANPAAHRLFGHAEGGLIGRRFREIVHEDELEDDLRLFERLVEGEIPHFLGERRYVTPDGGTVSTYTGAALVADADGTPDYIVVTVSDITERVETEIQLRSARDEAERANAAKSTFLSSMSHELRTPLNSILGFAQLLELDPQVSAQQKEQIRQIRKGGDLLLDLINEVLDLARVESGRMTLSFENVAIGPAVAETLEIVRPLAAERSITIRDHASRHYALFAYMDRTRFKQILLNLLSNAVKYNRDGGSIEITCDHTDAVVSLRVADTGRGIPADQFAELFEPFNRLQADSTNVRGAGIGLALAKRLVEAMHGSIAVESVVGEGSCFTLHIPYADHALEEAEELAHEIEELPVEAARTRHVVLYVEDNPANLRLIQNIIDLRRNVELLSAPHAAVGIELARAHKPDLVILDIDLPDMDGFEALARLRNMEETRDLAIIALSANAMPRDVEKGIEAGFMRYLTKPVNVQEFLQTLDELLGDIEHG